MLKNRKTSAAIVGLLDAIKSEGIKPLQESDFPGLKQQEKAEDLNSRPEHPLTSNKGKDADDQTISYEIKLLNTEKCRPWYMANRLNEYLTVDSCAELIESIKKVGQQIPVIVRKSKDWDGYDLICGARRLFSCKTLGLKVKAAVVDLSDKEALLAMDAENRPRSDISPYERACDYKRWIEQGIYKNYSEVLNSVGLKKAWFSQLISLADIPDTVIKAFSHPSNLKQKWGYELSKICKTSDELEASMIDKAKTLIGKNLTPDQVFKELKSIAFKKERTDLSWVKNKAGDPVFRFKFSKNGEANIVFHSKIPEKTVHQIINSIKELL